jgi:hypothetical protein
MSLNDDTIMISKIYLLYTYPAYNLLVIKTRIEQRRIRV